MVSHGDAKRAYHGRRTVFFSKMRSETECAHFSPSLRAFCAAKMKKYPGENLVLRVPVLCGTLVVHMIESLKKVRDAPKLSAGEYVKLAPG